jgi:hypothetical protein
MKFINAAANVMNVFLRTGCIKVRLPVIKASQSRRTPSAFAKDTADEKRGLRAKFRRLIFNDWNSCPFVLIRG